MKLRVAFGGLILGLLLVPALSGADAKKKFVPPPPIAKLTWLVGNWRYELNGRVIDEQWMLPGGGVMLGMARTVVKGKMVEHEFLTIRGGPAGALYYVARPSGQTETIFQATTVGESEVVFSNPQHDFPQTIRYTLKDDGTLVAAIEGPQPDGQLKRIEVSYQRFKP